MKCFNQNALAPAVLFIRGYLSYDIYVENSSCNGLKSH